MKREEQDIMAATEWKQKVKSKENEQSKKKRSHHRTNNPETQLVQFMSNSTCGSLRPGLTSRGQEQNSRFQVKFNLPVANEQSQAITIDGGKMIYIPKTKDDLKYIRCNGSSNKTFNKESNLLGIPLSELLRRTEVIERKSMKRKRIRRENEPDVIDDVNDEEMKDLQIDKHRLQDSQLWVDKHAPRSFTDLLSDERTNREVLRAVRAWDPFVFKKEVPKRPQMYTYHNDNDRSKPTNTPTNAKEDAKTKAVDLRPDEQNRVILLSGPPGKDFVTTFKFDCVCRLPTYNSLKF